MTFTGPPERRTGLLAYIAALAVSSVAVTTLAAMSPDRPPGHAELLVLPLLGVLLVAAECLLVRLRSGRHVDALNLIEAVLAPLLFAFDAPLVVVTVALAQIAAGVIKRIAPVKTAFNIAQWSLAAALGSFVVETVAGDPGFSARNAAAVVVALVVVSTVNFVAMVIVLALAQPQPFTSHVRRVAPRMAGASAWGSALGIAVGALNVAAYAASPATSVLFAVPLVVLHLAYSGLAAARIDRARMEGLRRASAALATSLHPHEALGKFLVEVRRAYEARLVVLVLDTDAGAELHRADEAGTAAELVRSLPPDSLEALALSLGQSARFSSRDAALGAALTVAGGSECLAALLVDGEVRGALMVIDQAGLEVSWTTNEIPVLEALARETASVLAKGRLLEAVLEERAKLAEIVGTTSDGILTLSETGLVLSWNSALERITGLPAARVIGTAGSLDVLSPQDADGRPVDLARWAQVAPPTELHVTATDGSSRRLTCSYSTAAEERSGERTLVVVARDVTPADRYAELRAQFERVAAAEAAQRIVVDHLQSAVTPAPLKVPDVDLGVWYVASDPSAPTGGDLYDWQWLPNGELHIAVVDVLGHGVGATKDALAVVHALRLLAIAGVPLAKVIARADELLAGHNRELVATAMVVRYDPATGRARIASGGHPPALVVSSSGAVLQVNATGGAIGWPGAGSDEVADIVLAPDDTLLLYTDGLVEARKDVIAGLEALSTNASGVATRPAAELARTVVE
ncbi:MAG: SpoIIE family protein phosphatase, partial [Actinomycetota bacterium]|nr:SpoIIE family protein phosphatase [Actinomycetota bacterium]